jgi:nitrite reductase (cytochrome c-552)
MLRAAAALTDMLGAIGGAKKAGATPQSLEAALALQRKAQWRLDFVAAENSMGFHAPAEAARILAESIDYSRQGQLAAQSLDSVNSAQRHGPPTPPPGAGAK